MAQGYRDFTSGETLTAANVEEYLLLQTTMRFASAAARNSALSGVLTEGLRAYLIDTNTETIYTGSGWSTIGPVHGAGLSWTPAVVQSGAVTTTVNGATYHRMGRRVWGDFEVTCTGTGTGTNLVTVSLPVTAANYSTAYHSIGMGGIRDESAAQTFNGHLILASSTTMKFLRTDTTGDNQYLGASGFTAALTTTPDIVWGSFHYEAAADA